MLGKPLFSNNSRFVESDIFKASRIGAVLSLILYIKVGLMFKQLRELMRFDSNPNSWKR
jgi:hypothetical protein